MKEENPGLKYVKVDN